MAENVKALIEQAMKDREAAVVVTNPLRYEQGKLVLAKTTSQIVSETARRISTREPEFDGKNFMADLINEVSVEKRYREAVQPALVDVKPLSVEDLKALTVHQDSHNVSEPVANYCKFCESERAVNKENNHVPIV
jgi:hypothetical protein